MSWLDQLDEIVARHRALLCGHEANLGAGCGGSATRWCQSCGIVFIIFQRPP